MTRKRRLCVAGPRKKAGSLPSRRFCAHLGLNAVAQRDAARTVRHATAAFSIRWNTVLRSTPATRCAGLSRFSSRGPSAFRFPAFTVGFFPFSTILTPAAPRSCAPDGPQWMTVHLVINERMCLRFVGVGRVIGLTLVFTVHLSASSPSP